MPRDYLTGKDFLKSGWRMTIASLSGADGVRLHVLAAAALRMEPNR
jgi:hypothetical protein